MNSLIPKSDRELATAWSEGDRTAGAAFFNRHHDSLSRFFISKVGLVETEDLVQETLLGFIQSFPKYRGEAKVRTYLFVIARNKLNDHLSRRVRDRKRFDPAQSSVADLKTGLSQKIARYERDQLLLRALRMLPVDTQIMLELYYWERLKIAEVATIVEKTPANVKVTLHRGRKRLEVLMERLADSREAFEASMTSLSRWAERVREEREHRGESMR